MTREPAPTLTRRQVLLAGSAAAAGIALRPLDGLAAPRALAPRRAGLDAYVRDRMRAGGLPGLSAAIVADGRVAWTRGFGSANLWRDRPVRPDTLFMLASISKTAIATAVMQAVEDELFGLDDDVDTILPFSVRLPTHPHRPVTVRQLLTHTSGILDRWAVWDDLYVPGDSRIPLGTFLRDYLVPGRRYYRRANFSQRRPGTKYAYSNVGASLAAYLVEVASGTGFDRWCQQRIFEPLGMTRAGWHLADVPARDVAMPYRWIRRDGTFRAHGQYGYPDYPDGALRATPRALGAHLGMMMQGGTWKDARVLRRTSVGQLLTPQVPGIATGQGLLWYRFNRKGRPLWGHNGSDMGVATAAFFDPKEDVGVIVLGNGDWHRAGGAWPLQQVMTRLFEDAPRLAGGSA